MPDLTSYFVERIRRYGDDPRAAGWNSRESQERRFAVVDEVLERREDLLDVGCGPGHLHDYLRARGWTGRYLGVDLLPQMVELARAAGRPAEVGDLAGLRASLPPGGGAGPAFDVVVSSGVVSMQLGSAAERGDWLASHLRDAAATARRAVVVNFLSRRYGLSSPDRWFVAPGEMVEQALDVAPRCTVRHDYFGDYDCTVVLHLETPTAGPEGDG